MTMDKVLEHAEGELGTVLKDILRKTDSLSSEQLDDPKFVKEQLGGLIELMRQKTASVRQRNQLLEDRRMAIAKQKIQSTELKIDLEGND